MKKSDVIIGATYRAKVTGKLAKVRIDSEAPYGGWLGTNLETKRQVHIKSAQRLRGQVSKPKAKAPTKAMPTGRQADSGGDLYAILLGLAQAPAEFEMNAQLLPGELAKAAKLPQAAVEKAVKQDDGELLAVGSAGHVYLTALGKKKAKGLLRTAKVRTGSPQSPRVAPGKPKAKADTKAEPSGTRARKGCLSAAVEILKDANEAMSARAIVTAALGRGLWATNGKTPEATLYAAIIREIAAKGDGSRFRKAARGRFELAGKES